jgi:hypothetical protein
MTRVKAIALLTFWPIFDLFSKMEKVDENGRKVKAIGAGPPVIIQLSAGLLSF